MALVMERPGFRVAAIAGTVLAAGVLAAWWATQGGFLVEWALAVQTGAAGTLAPATVSVALLLSFVVGATMIFNA